jgi:two-component system, sporulation sensor kinase E
MKLAGEKWLDMYIAPKVVVKYKISTPMKKLVFYFVKYPTLYYRPIFPYDVEVIHYFFFGYSYTNNQKMGSENLSQSESFVRMIAHEIRNPLTAISIANKLLKEGIRENRDSEMLDIYIDILHNNAGKIEQLIRKLLELKEEELSLPMPVDLCHLIDHTISKAADRIFLQNVTISKSYTPGNLTKGNAEKLVLAFLNILINAIESMEQKEGKLWITVYRVDNIIKVIFKDNGKGMEAESWGFGLTHVKEILDEHEATITLNSKPGNGTSVTIVFKGL